MHTLPIPTTMNQFESEFLPRDKDKYVGVDTQGFETEFAREVFLTWHSNNRNVSRTAEFFSLNKKTVTDWMNRFHWNERANKIEANAQKQLEDELALDRKARIKQQLKTGTMLRSKGTEFLLNNPGAINNADTALKFIKVGIDIEREADPLPAFLESIATAPSDQIAAMIAALQEQKRLALTPEED